MTAESERTADAVPDDLSQDDYEILIGYMTSHWGVTGEAYALRRLIDHDLALKRSLLVVTKRAAVLGIQVETVGCPQCKGTRTVGRFSAVLGEVMIERCPTCHGDSVVERRTYAPGPSGEGEGR